jgi:IclR family transcriptional regulator, KDG regulon repressor
MNHNSQTQRKIIGSVQRALDILNLFETQVVELGTSEIARSLDLPKSTIAGLVHTLVLNGYLSQRPETRKYHLGFKLVERAGVLLSQFDLRKVSAPVLTILRDEINESVNLALRDGGYVVYIERMHGMNMLGMRSEIGKRELAHSTALGKVMLAFSPEHVLNDFLKTHSFDPVTPHTIVDPADFLNELKQTCKRGYAVDNQENELGGRCVAAPIFDYTGQAIAAVSISVPLQRIPDHRIDPLGRRVKAAAAEISQRLGAAPSHASNHAAILDL